MRDELRLGLGGVARAWQGSSAYDVDEGVPAMSEVVQELRLIIDTSLKVTVNVAHS